MNQLTQRHAKPVIKQVVAFFLWAIVVVFLFSKHENWRDGAQSWLLARDLDIPGLVAQMKYEGHPCLWHLLLMPFIRLGLPYETMNIISIVITAISVILLLWKAPFPFIIRIVCLFGAALLYLMPVVSRSYCLIPLFLFLNACCYPSRSKHPVFYGLTIALLVQTHIYMLGMAGIMSCVWLAEAFCTYKKDRNFKKLMRQGIGLLLPLLSFLFLMIQVSSSANQSSAFGRGSVSLYSVLFSFVRNFKIEDGFMLSFNIAKAYSSIFSIILALVFVSALAIFTLYQLHRKNHEGLKIILIFSFGLLVRVLITAFLYSHNNAQKMTISFFMVLWMLWCMWNHMSIHCGKRFMLIALGAICIVNTLNTLDVIRDISNPYTDAKNCAEYINNNIPQDALIFQGDDAIASAIIPYSNRNGFYSLRTGEYTSYAVWKDTDSLLDNYDALNAYAKSITPDAEEAYLLSCPRASEDYCSMFFSSFMCEENLVYKTTSEPLETIEAYSIYRIPLQQD